MHDEIAARKESLEAMVPARGGVSPEDQRDLDASLEGDEEAYRHLVSRYQDDISRQMWRFTRDAHSHAELVQDVFVQAYLNLRTFKGRAPFGHWLRRIATNRGYRHWRGLEREERRREKLAWEARRQGGIEEPTTPSDAAQLTHMALSQLPAAERLVLTLLHLDGDSIDEIAEKTGWSKSNVKVRAFRARKKLRRILEDAGIGSKNDVP